MPRSESPDRLWQSVDKIPARENIVEEIRRTPEANEMSVCIHVRPTLRRGVKITSGMDPRLNQSGTDVSCLRNIKHRLHEDWTHIDHEQDAPAAPEVSDARIHHANLLNSILAKIEANNARAEDALILDTRGFVAETNATLIFIVRKGDAATSRVVACPEGITRATVLEICAVEKIPCAETELKLEHVYRADEVFCTSTMGELAGVTSVDKNILGRGEVGPITVRLSELYAEQTAAEGFQVV